MPARVVLPRPGGPAKSRWSAAWPRRRAASRMIVRCSLSSAWPTNSASARGRRPDLVGDLVARRDRLGVEQLVAHRRLTSPRATARRCRACLSSTPASPSSGRSASASRDLVGAVAEAGSASRTSARADGADRAVDGRRRRRRPRSTSGRSRRDFSSTSRRAAVFCRRPGTRQRAATSSSASDPAQGVGRVHREDGQRQRGADAVGAEQRLEADPLVAGGEAVERLGVLADVVVDVDEHLVAEVAER